MISDNPYFQIPIARYFKEGVKSYLDLGRSLFIDGNDSNVNQAQMLTAGDYKSRAQPFRTPVMFEDSRIFTSEIIESMNGKNVHEFFKFAPESSTWPLSISMSQINSNYPIEDRGLVYPIMLKDKIWTLACVFDGHGGWQTSEYVCKEMGKRIEKKLQELDAHAHTPDAISTLITETFSEIDEDLKNKIDGAISLGHSRVGRPGSTATIVIINDTHVISANIGDSEAFMYQGGDVTALTRIHNAGEPEEADRLRRAHPDEDNIIYTKPISKRKKKVTDPSSNSLLRALTDLRLADFNVPRLSRPASYTKGRLQLTRAFGDFYLKGQEYAIDWDKGRMSVKKPYSFPYIHIMPSIHVVERNPKDEFVIIASDGIWDELNGVEAGNIVRKALASDPDAKDASELVKQVALKRAAWRSEVDIEGALAMPASERRRVYDDMTCIVVNLAK